MKALLPWDEAEEVTFECEPGPSPNHKLQPIREVGVTRLSLGVETSTIMFWTSTAGPSLPRDSPRL